MLNWAEYVKFFVALVVIVNPISALPLFVSMTANNCQAEKMQIARVASISVAVVLSPYFPQLPRVPSQSGPR